MADSGSNIFFKLIEFMSHPSNKINGFIFKSQLCRVVESIEKVDVKLYKTLTKENKIEKLAKLLLKLYMTLTYIREL